MKEEKVQAKPAEADAAIKPTGFTREQLLKAKVFRDRRDALGAVLEDGKTYTIQEADKLLDRFMKGQVK